MKYLLILFALFPLCSFAQQTETQLSICQQKALEHFPLVKQQQLIQNIEKDKLKDLSTARLPQNDIAAQATYQSAVPTLPIQLPNITITPVDKQQFRATDETKILLFDGGEISARKAMVRASSLVDLQKNKVDLYSIKTSVTQLYSNILENDARIELLEILGKNIDDRLGKVKSGVDAGTVLPANLYVLQAEQLTIKQSITEARSNRKGLIDVMNIYTGDSYTEETHFQMPSAEPVLTEEIARPEISLFDYQKKAFNVQNKLINSTILPKFSGFFQGGIGRPGLNILDNDVKGFYVTGIRMSWSLSALYNHKRDKNILDNQEKMVDVQKESFELQIKGQLAKQKEEIAKINLQLQQDKDIITLRNRVASISANQLDVGVITSSDYLIELNAQNQALVNQKLHEIQLVFAYIQYNIIKG